MLRDNTDIKSLTAGHLQLKEEPGDDIDTSSPAVGPAESSEDQRRPQRPRRRYRIPITAESIN